MTEPIDYETPELVSRRVAVAEDALTQFRAHKLDVATGAFIHLKGTSNNYNISMIEVRDWFLRKVEEGVRDLRSIIEEVAGNCHVCARGALVLSKARLYNAVPLGSLFTQFGISQASTTAVLMDTFSPEQLDLIEAAFECTARYSSAAYDSSEFSNVLAAMRFGKRYEDPGERLVAVLENLIANSGTFRPPGELAEE